MTSWSVKRITKDTTLFDKIQQTETGRTACIELLCQIQIEHIYANLIAECLYPRTVQILDNWRCNQTKREFHDLSTRFIVQFGCRGRQIGHAKRPRVKAPCVFGSNVLFANLSPSKLMWKQVKANDEAVLAFEVRHKVLDAFAMWLFKQDGNLYLKQPKHLENDPAMGYIHYKYQKLRGRRVGRGGICLHNEMWYEPQTQLNRDIATNNIDLMKFNVEDEDANGNWLEVNEYENRVEWLEPPMKKQRLD